MLVRIYLLILNVFKLCKIFVSVTTIRNHDCIRLESVFELLIHIVLCYAAYTDRGDEKVSSTVFRC